MLTDEQKKRAKKVALAVSRMTHQIKTEIDKVTGKCLFKDIPLEERMANAEASMRSGLEAVYAKKASAFDIAVKPDPDDSTKAIVTITAKNKWAEGVIKKHLAEQEAQA